MQLKFMKCNYLNKIIPKFLRVPPFKNHYSDSLGRVTYDKCCTQAAVVKLVRLATPLPQNNGLIRRYLNCVPQNLRFPLTHFPCSHNRENPKSRTF